MTEKNPGGSKARFIPAVVMLVLCIIIAGTGLVWVFSNMMDGLYGAYFNWMPLTLLAVAGVFGYASYGMFRNKD